MLQTNWIGLNRSIFYICYFLLSVTLLSACATVPTDFEEPAVSVTSFKPKNSGGITPQFEIVLHVTNPNREPLEIEGMSYSIELANNEVMSGVSNDFPTIEPYGEAEVTLNATANLWGGFNLITGLANTKPENIEYVFKAKIDVGIFMPTIKVVRKGKL